MNMFPLINPWVDIVILAIIFAAINKLLQHLFADPKRYFKIKKEIKEISEELKQLYKEQKVEEANKKQKESMKLVGEQFKLTMKPMVYVMVVAFPLLYFIKHYYGEIIYDFGLFSVAGLWAYIIIGMVVSIIITTVYDKMFVKKYENN
jgi:uncharacterized membrane protein (DUF106 family)